MQSNIPAAFFPQLLVRLFKEKMPRFYAIICTNSIWFTVGSVLLPIIITDALPGMGIVVPMWLTYANIKIVALFSTLAGMGIGSAVVAGTTIQGASPPLVTGKPSTEELLKQQSEKLDLLQSQINEFRIPKS